MTKVVQEKPEHFEAVHQLTVDAFADSELGHNGEADFIGAIRDQCDELISLVAIEAGHVVGHVLFSPATIRWASLTMNGMGLAPMAVHPSHQCRGVGSLLVRESLRLIAETDATFTLVAGHPNYYPRFGFVPASRYFVTHGFAGMPQDILFIHVSDENVIAELENGLAYYHSSFGPQHNG